MSRVLVIGAGIGGMSAAIRLAKAGHQVEIFEGSDQVGGKCRTKWIGSVAFDTGPTLLTLPAVYRDLFISTGDSLDSVLDLVPVNPSFDYRFANGDSVVFENLSRLQTLGAIRGAFGEKSALDWNSLMLRAERMWDVSRTPFIESELNSLFSLAKRPSFLRDLQTIAPWKSLRSLVKEISPDQRLQYIVDRYATYSGSDPRRAPAVLLSIAFVEEAFGAWHIRGGVGKLALAMNDRAMELGIKIHLNAQVVAINQKQGRATGITLKDAMVIEAEIVVANADATQVYSSLLAEPLPQLRKPRRALRKASPSLSGFSIYLALKRDTRAKQLRHHTVLFPANYDAEFDAIFSKGIPVEDPAIYICAPQDSEMVKDQSSEGWSILINAPRHSLNGAGWNWNDPIFAQEYSQKIINRIEAHGYAIRNRLLRMDIRTPADLEGEVMAPGGSIYGTSSNGVRSAFTRARNRSPIKGLFCVGGSAHPGGGLPLVGISAEIVAKAIGKA